MPGVDVSCTHMGGKLDWVTPRLIRIMRGDPGSQHSHQPEGQHHEQAEPDRFSVQSSFPWEKRHHGAP